MIGIMLTTMEAEELKMLLKGELDELLSEMMLIKGLQIRRRSMEERYRILFGVFSRIASESDKYKYQTAFKMLK